MLVLKQPIGVVGLITAWNFPAWNIARAGGAALAAGCPIVVRPSEYTPMTGDEPGADAGRGRRAAGRRQPGQRRSRARWARRCSPIRRCAKIHFTGSTRVGRLLMDGASKTITRLSLELGGNAPVLVFPDVDLDQVVAGATAAKFRNGGQVCVSPQRFLVATRGRAGLRREGRRRGRRRSASAPGSMPPPRSDRSSTPGSAIASRRWSPARAAGGARVAVGGARPPDRDKGYFYQPTVVDRRRPGRAALPRGDLRAGAAGEHLRRRRRRDRAGQPDPLRPRRLRVDEPPADGDARRRAARVRHDRRERVDAARPPRRRSPAGKKAASAASRAPKASTSTSRRSWSPSAGCRDERAPSIRRSSATLGRWDLVLLKIVAIVNLNNVPAAAVYGWFSLALWMLAFLTFFVPEAIAVLVLSRRYPGEGGIYLWIRQQFGEAHGFLAGWCYWATNLFYVPVLLVYMAGVFAFAGGEGARRRAGRLEAVRRRAGLRLAGRS